MFIYIYIYDNIQLHTVIRNLWHWQRPKDSNDKQAVSPAFELAWKGEEAKTFKVHRISWDGPRDHMVYGWDEYDEWAQMIFVFFTEIAASTTCLNITLWLCQNSYWKWPFIVVFPIKNGDFP